MRSVVRREPLFGVVSHVSDVESQLRLEFVGALDAYSAPSLSAVVEDLPDADADVLLDLGGVDFIDASCLCVIQRLGRSLGFCGHELSVLAQPRLIDLMIQLGLRDSFPGRLVSHMDERARR